MKKILVPILFSVCLSVSGKTYYVATNGNDLNNGTSLKTPYATWQKGINMAQPGDTIFVRGGIYYLSGINPWVTIDPTAHPTGKGRSGTKAKPICFWAYPPDYESGNHPILDCKNAYESYGTNFSCFGLNAVEYWHIKGITVRNAYQRGVSGRRPQGFGATYSRNLKFENCTAHNISARGFYYESGAWNSWESSPYWPYEGEHNHDTTYFINCDAYDIRDSVNCSAGDGWKCGNYYGGVMIFDGCRAWNYSDDGFDPGGAGKRIIKNCWAMSTDKYNSLCGGNVETNGFKTGGIGRGGRDRYPYDYVFVEISNCLAAHNGGIGFYNNLEMVYENNAKYLNNTSYQNQYGFFDMPTNTVSRGSEYRNNIAYNNREKIYEQAGIYYPSVYLESNNTWVATQRTGEGSWPGWIYNPAFTLIDNDFVSLDASQIMLPRKSDGSLPDITFMKLKSTSQFIDAGIDVGLPYKGKAPDLGYAEYGSGPANPPSPTFVNTSIENTTPSRLEMTYNLALANIVPPTTAFTVRVNNTARNVSSVSISGTKVYLNLASPVVYGDAVTISYTKPQNNPLQTTAGGQAATLNATAVTNNVTATAPVHINSVIENATPSRLEMTYSLTLANVVPSVTAFTVRVNNTARNVSSVSISGAKVYLNLASPIVYGDAVTVAYTKPASKPLQTTEGGQAATLTAQTVLNNCRLIANQPPVANVSSPSKNDTFTAPATIIIDALVNDPAGSIVKVEFFSDQIKLGEVLNAPYSFTWKDVPEGTYSIYVTAIDNKNTQTVSVPVAVVVESTTTTAIQNPEIDFNNINQDISGSRIVNIFPNPTEGCFHVNMSGITENERSFIIYNLSGQILHSEHSSGHDLTKEFDLSELPTGTFILVVSSGHKITDSKKIIKR